jgi:hypothetical protein
MSPSKKRIKTSTPSSPRLDGLSNAEIKRLLARSSPAGLAAVASRGKWIKARHLELLDRKLVAVAKGIENRTSPRLLIDAPPRHGKSELSSKNFPGWFLGRYPDLRVILTSYETSFAREWGQKTRDLLNEQGEHFGVQIRPDSSAADRWDIAGHTGGMRTAGVGTGITGKGAHLFLIDDPVKDAAEANSETYRKNTWDWYRSTAYTRVEPGGAIVVIQTRWHEEDLTGKILAHAAETGEQWDVLHLPALSEGPDVDVLGRELDQPLWPERYDRKALELIRATLGSYWFSALYQGRPQPAEGGAFKRSWFKYWRFEAEDELFVLDCA